MSRRISGYATGCYSNRKIERATDDPLAFRCIAGNGLPDHDTLASVRRRFNQESLILTKRQSLGRDDLTH